MTTTPAELDTAIAELEQGAKLWTTLTLTDRIDLLRDLSASIERHAEEWVKVATGIKQLAADSPLVGEEWISGPYALATSVGALTGSLAAIAAGGSPLDGYHVSEAPGDRLAVRVLPHNIFDRLLLHGFTAEVWSKPGVTRDQLRDSAGLAERNPEAGGGVGLVLGAGNIFSIAPLDTLYELFANNRVVLLKLNPITDPLKPVLEKVFARFVELGLVRVVTGGIEVGTQAIAHRDVNHVHITGSIRSHDAIVFGPGAEGRARQARGEALLDKPITNELGGVSPTIVVPGRWSKGDLKFQAEHLVTQKLHNNGYNCVASQVVVLSDDWKQRDAFLAALRTAYDTAIGRMPYYPGSDDRTSAAFDSHPGAKRLGSRGSRILLEGLSATEDEVAYTEEYFGPVLSITTLPGTGQAFVDQAVDFANERLAGTLGANIVIHPRTLKQLGEGFTEALARMRYGTIAINAWTGVGYLASKATWGAFPGHTIDDVQSGIGIVHNGLLLDHTERTIVRGPFRPFPRSVLTGHLAISPRPPWFVTNKTAAVTGRRLARFATSPSWAKLPGIFASALRG